MFKFLKTLWGKLIGNKTSAKKINKDINYLCSLNFELNYDSTININCYWPDLENLDKETLDLIASQYGILIYMINNGLLKTDIINTLTSVAKSDNVFDSLFVQEVLVKWIEFSEKHPKQSASQPVVRPSSVFKR